MTRDQPSGGRIVLGVIGGSVAGPVVVDLARRVGAEICRTGCHLVCGGRGGVMEAACRGFVEAREAGEGDGVTVGVLPGDVPSEANPFVDVSLPTGIGLARNAVVVRTAQALVAVGGGSGTLSEIALAWQFGRPVASVAGSGGWSERLAGETLDGKGPPPLPAPAEPEAAVGRLLAILRRET